jgi:hypothetical protein
MKRLAVSLGAALLLTGCAGYQTTFELPAHLKTFSVATFVNRTLEVNLDMEFTQAVVKEIEAKTPLRLAREEEADLVVTGDIATLDRHLVRTQGHGTRGIKGEVRDVLCVNVRITDRKEDRPFFEGTRLTSRAAYRLNRGEDARQAREEVIRELASHVVSLAFERWPNPHPPVPIVEGQPSAQ